MHQIGLQQAMALNCAEYVSHDSNGLKGLVAHCDPTSGRLVRLNLLRQAIWYAFYQPSRLL